MSRLTLDLPSHLPIVKIGANSKKGNKQQAKPLLEPQRRMENSGGGRSSVKDRRRFLCSRSKSWKTCSSYSAGT